MNEPCQGEKVAVIDVEFIRKIPRIQVFKIQSKLQRDFYW